jgi:hypothetical protein
MVGETGHPSASAERADRGMVSSQIYFTDFFRFTMYGRLYSGSMLVEGAHSHERYHLHGTAVHEG